MPGSIILEKILLQFIILFLCSLLFSCNKSSPAAPKQTEIGAEGKSLQTPEDFTKPPVAKIIPEKKIYNGEAYIDNYFWLRDKKNTEVIKYLETENKYADYVLKRTKGLERTLFQEMSGRIKESDVSVAEKIGNYFYYTRMEEGKQYPVYWRKKARIEGKEEILLDQNIFSRDKNVFALGSFSISPNHNYLAYSIDTKGSEEYTIFVKDLHTGQLLNEKISGTFGNIIWTNDNKYLYYCTFDKLQRPYQTYKHRLGAKQSEDLLIYHEKDPAFSMELTKSKSEAFIFLTSYSGTTTEIRYIGAKDQKEHFHLFQKRKPGIEYHLEHNGGKFLVLTNSHAKNFKLMEVPVLEQFRNNWHEIIPHNFLRKLISFQSFKNHIAVYFRENGLPKLRIINLKSNKSYDISFSEPTYSVWLENNRNFNTNTLRFSYSSFVTPDSIYEYNMDKKTRKLLKRKDIPGGFNSENYLTERVFAASKDGTLIPISLVYKKGLEINNNPLLLHAYGAYGDTKDPTFVPERLSLIDRGFIFAIAHIRGGGEMGSQWYDEGKRLNKKNSFYDFISSAEFLIKNNYTSNEKLVIYGRSAGGLLMGAVTTMRPDLFKAVIAEVPFVDVINTMMDPELPLTLIEYDEWGNPNYKREYDYMMSYSPYDNVKTVNYPNMFITAGLNDPWVGYWEPAKFVAKLRKMKTDNNTIIFKTDLDAGHKGSSGIYDGLKNRSEQYAFILDLLVINR